MTGFEGGGGGAFTGLGGPTEVAVGLGPGSGGADVETGLEEPMNFTDSGGATFFFCGGVTVFSTSFTVGFVVSDS